MKKILLFVILVLLAVASVGCDETSGSQLDKNKTIIAANSLQERQPTPTDIDYSIPRWLLIRRAYFVNGQREKARILPCPIADIPLGYVVLYEGNVAVGRFVVEGMVISLNTYLTPDSEYYEKNGSRVDGHYHNAWLADVDGTYGSNDDGIFFFTPDGKYIEHKGGYTYSDIPFEVKDPILKMEGLQ